jgi:anti-sigma factor RsiW
MRSPNWRLLNGYVDGALDSTEAAAVAEAAGDDPKIAAQIAALYRLKGVTHEAFPDAPPDLAALVRPRPRRWRSAAGALAATMLVAATLAAFWPAPSANDTALPSDLFSAARALHSEWLAADASGGAEDPPATLIGALAHFRQLPAVPDLESARLTITRIRFATRDNIPVLQIGYRGRHDCHLSLFVFTGAELPADMTSVNVGNERAYGWRVNNLEYLLFARGMDRNMLDLIARNVEQQTRTHTPFDAPTREALAAQKSRSESCAV